MALRNPLTPKQKAAWIKALRSGKYKQGRSRLKLTNPNTGKSSYCCLGVLNEVCDLEVGSNRFLKDWENEDWRYVALPEKVQAKLADLNDDDVPFEVIAGLIDVAL